MRKFTLLLIVLMAGALVAQVYNPYPGKLVPTGGSGSGATSLDGLSDVTVGATPPGTCTDDSLYLDTSEAIPAERLKICESNTWYKVAELTAGDYIDITGRTISLSTSVPIYSSAAGAPSGVCTAGREFYLNTTTTDLYRCPVSGTWALIPYYTTGSGAPASGDCDAAGEFGRFYARTDNTSGASPLYVCGQTGSGTYGWSQPLTSTGNAATATALAANGMNCSSGQYPLGVDASGNAESCTAAGSGGGGAPFSYLGGITRWAALTGNGGTSQITYTNIFFGSVGGTHVSYTAGANGAPPYRTLTTAETTNTDTYEYTNNAQYSGADDSRAIAWVQFPTYSVERQFIGFTQSAPATQLGNDTGSTAHFAGFRCSTSVPDTNWQAITKDASTAGTTDTGIPCGSTAHVFDVGTSDGGTTWEFKMDGNTVAVRTTNIPLSTAVMNFMFGTRTLEDSAKTMRWSFLQVTNKPW